MKIINREEFLKLPAGTLYCKYTPNYWDAPKIKYNTITISGKAIDWGYQNLTSIVAHDGGELGNRIDLMVDYGISYPLEMNCIGRDGLYDHEQLFLIYERADLEKLIKELTECTIDNVKKLAIIEKYIKPGDIITHERCMGCIEEHIYTGRHGYWFCGKPTKDTIKLGDLEKDDYADDISVKHILYINRVPVVAIPFLHENSKSPEAE